MSDAGEAGRRFLTGVRVSGWILRAVGAPGEFKPESDWIPVAVSEGDPSGDGGGELDAGRPARRLVPEGVLVAEAGCGRCMWRIEGGLHRYLGAGVGRIWGRLLGDWPNDNGHRGRTSWRRNTSVGTMEMTRLCHWMCD